MRPLALPTFALATLLTSACGPSLSPTLAPGGASSQVTVLPPPPPPIPATEVWGPSALVDENPAEDVVEVTLTAAVAPVSIDGAAPIMMYTYNGQTPGPRLEAKVGDRVIVHFKNELPQATTVHWHGLRIPDAMDGSPRIQSPVLPGQTFTYDFVVPEAGSFWYHPHVRANEQVEKGLYGPIIVRERDAAKEPRYAAERVLVLDDVLLTNGQFAPFLASHPEEMHGRFGNTLLLNGKDTSTPARVEVPHYRVERWRLVNTANARTMSLSIAGATFRVIGTDGGLLRAPYGTTRLTLPVGQRYDVEVTFDRVGEVALNSHVLVQDASGNVVEQTLPQLLVTVDAAEDDYPLVSEWTLPAETPRAVDREVTLTFDAVNDPVMGLMWRINGVSHPVDPLFTFRQGETVRLVLVNRVGPEHPFHLHGQFFEVEEAGQPGLKDTVLVPGLSTVRVVARFDNPGRWMAHCHILEHAELGMMSEVVVSP